MHLTRRAPCPLLLAVGEAEGPEYLRQTETLAERWSDAGEAPRPLVMEGLDHFSIVDELQRPDSALSGEMHALMGVA